MISETWGKKVCGAVSSRGTHAIPPPFFACSTQLLQEIHAALGLSQGDFVLSYLRNNIK